MSRQRLRFIRIPEIFQYEKITPPGGLSSDCMISSDLFYLTSRVHFIPENALAAEFTDISELI